MSVLKKLPVNETALLKLLETQRTTSDDWSEWLRRLSVEVLKESPSHALRACANLANVYSPLARDLFNAAFVSCWGGLHAQLQDELMNTIKTAFRSKISPEIHQVLLNLAEYVERVGLEWKTIGVEELGNYAKGMVRWSLNNVVKKITASHLDPR